MTRRGTSTGVLGPLSCLPVEVLCPNCFGRVMTCHSCDSTGRVAIEKMFALTTFVWAKPGCSCEACATLPSSGVDGRRSE